MEKKAVIYTRVSDPSQVDNNSLDSQEKICRHFAKTEGYNVVQVFREEGVSAKHTHNRIRMREMFSFATKKTNNISAIITYKFDRFSRNLEEGLATISLLAKYKVIVMSATERTDESPMGTAMRNIMMTLGQLDNELKGERVKDNMKEVFRKGLWPFKCPVGYKRQFNTKEENKGIPSIKDPFLAPIIERMFEKAAQGIYSKSQLARVMNVEGFGEHYRVKADHKIVKSILEKTFYFGKMYAKKWDEYATGLHQPITDEITWQRAYHYLILKKKNYKYQDETLYPLKGVLKCEYCKYPMTSSPSRGRNGIVYYYECRKKTCRKLRINAQKAHIQFEGLLEKIKPSPRVIKLFQFMVFSEWDKVVSLSKNEAERLEKYINALKIEFKSIRKAKDEGIYTKEEAVEEAERIRQEIRISEIERSEIKIDQYNGEIVREFISQFMQNLAFLWKNLDLPKQQAFLQKVFEGDLLCTVDKKIRTTKLSPSFELIRVLNEQKGENVSLTGFEPVFTE